MAKRFSINNFVFCRSAAFIVLTWTFAAALFIDASNATDLIPQTNDRIIHADEDAAIDGISVAATPFSALHTTEITKTGSLTKALILVDIDSPSTESIHHHTSVQFISLQEESASSCINPFTVDKLYLRHCALLV